MHDLVVEGEGQHIWLQIRTRNSNTAWIAERIARCAGVRRSGVGFAGLKDRNALTTRWFSVDMAGRQEPDWFALASDEVEVLSVVRDRREPRWGGLRGNCFGIVRRAPADRRRALEERLRRAAGLGMPNYFGEQRFGRDGNNVRAAYGMLVERRRVRDRHIRDLLLSGARSLLFNRIVSHRVAAGLWNRGVDSDVMMPDGSRRTFCVPRLDAVLGERVDRLDMHPTGPLWGAGEAPVAGEAAALKAEALAGCEVWLRSLEAAGLELARRALRDRVMDLAWERLGDDALRLEFSLPVGAYATVVLRECVRLRGGQ